MCEIANKLKNEGIKIGLEKGREEGRAKGRVEGREEGLAMAILGCLKDLGRVPEQVVSHIRAEKDLDVLQRWVRSAAHAASIAEFEQMM